MAKKRKKGINRVVAATLITAIATITSAGFWAIRPGKEAISLPFYEVKEVLDGDSFITAEDQRIRLAAVDAPELKLCGGKEAKEELGKLINGKKLYLKVIYRDGYNRLISYVYTTDKFVNEEMIRSGWGYYSSPPKNAPDELQLASQFAREKGLGIHGELCTQLSNPKQPACVIKGNHRVGKNYYSFPGCSNYDSTKLQLSLGDEWFCTEKEAQKAGYLKSGDCFGKIYQK